MASTEKNIAPLSQNALFQGQDVQQSAWVGSTLDGSRVVNSTLRDVAFLNSSLEGSTFAKVSLNNARFTNCDLRNVVIEGSDIESLNVNGVDVSVLLRKGPTVAPTETAGKLFIGDNLRPDVINRMGLKPIDIDLAIRAASDLYKLTGDDKSDGKEHSSDGNETGKEGGEGTGKEASDPEMAAFDKLIFVGQPQVVARFVKPVM